MDPHAYGNPVDGDENLWRRLTTLDWMPKNPDGSRRVSSAAFKGNSDDRELSVHVASLTTIDRIFNTLPECYGLAEVLAKHPQDLALRVEHTPEPEDDSHASVYLHPDYGQRKKHAKKLSKLAQLTAKP